MVWHPGMVLGSTPRYRARDMADHRVRRTWIRRATAALLAATFATVGSSTPGAVAAMPPIAAPAPSPAVIAPPPAVVEPVGPATATGSIGAGGPTLTPALGRALQTRLTNLRKKYAYPGRLGGDHLRRRHDLGRDERLRRRCRPRRRSPPTRRSRWRASRKTFTAALILGLVQDGKIGLDRPARAYLPSLKIGSEGHRPPAARPHERPARLLPQRADRPGPAQGPGPPLDDGASRSATSASRTSSRAAAGTTRTRTTSCSGMLAERVGGAPDRRRSCATRFLDPLGLDHTYYQAVEEPRGPVAHGYRFATAAKHATAIDLSDGTGGRAVHLGRHRGRRAPARIASTATRPRALGSRAVRAATSSPEATVGAMVDGRRAARPATGRRSPTGSASRASRSVGHPTLGHSGRLARVPLADALPARRGDRRSRCSPTRAGPTPAIIGRSLLKLALRSAPSCACQAGPLRRTGARGGPLNGPPVRPAAADGTDGDFPLGGPWAQRGGHARRGSRCRSGSTPTSTGGMASGVLARAGHLRDVLETRRLARPRASRLAGDRTTPRPGPPARSAIPIDDVLVAVADDDPHDPGPRRRGTPIGSRSARTGRGRAADAARVRPRPRPDPPDRRVRDAPRRPPRRCVDDPSPGVPVGHHALVNRYGVDRVSADLMLGFFFPGAGSIDGRRRGVATTPSSPTGATRRPGPCRPQSATPAAPGCRPGGGPACGGRGARRRSGHGPTRIAERPRLDVAVGDEAVLDGPRDRRA